MSIDKLASLTEDLSGAPLCAAFQEIARRLIEEGATPVDVADAGLAVATALAVDANGMEKAAAGLLITANRLAAAVQRPAGRPN